jgi:hypothetical protein
MDKLNEMGTIGRRYPVIVDDIHMHPGSHQGLSWEHTMFLLSNRHKFLDNHEKLKVLGDFLNRPSRQCLWLVQHMLLLLGNHRKDLPG